MHSVIRSLPVHNRLRAKAIALILIFSVIFSTFANLPSTTAQGTETDFFFYYKDQKIPLTLSTEWIGIDHSGTAGVTVQYWVNNAPHLKDFSQVKKLHTFMSLFRLKEGVSAAEIVSTVDYLKIGDGGNVNWVNPVFVDSQGLLILADEFIVAFPPAMPRAEIDAMNEQYVVEIMRELRGMPNVFLMRIKQPLNPTMPTSPYTALTAANAYHESGKVVFAVPHFWRTTRYEVSAEDTLGLSDVRQYYYADGERRKPLFLSEHWLAVRFESTSADAQRQSLAAVESIGDMALAKTYADFTLVPLKNGLWADDAVNAALALDGQAGVAWANPVFSDFEGLLVYPQDMSALPVGEQNSVVLPAPQFQRILTFGDTLSEAFPLSQDVFVTPTGERRFYGYGDGVKVLYPPISTEFIAVSFAEGATAEAMSSQLAPVAPLLNFSASRAFGKGSYYLIPVQTGATASQLLEVSAAIATQPNVAWANVVLGDKTEGYRIPWTRLNVQFPADVNQTHVEHFVRVLGVAITNEPDTLLRSHRLEAPAAKVIDLANTFNESGRVVHAVPDIAYVSPEKVQSQTLPVVPPPSGICGLTSDQFTRLDCQWHLQNTGQYTGAIIGADIDAVEAWRFVTGSPSTIVAVIDDGIYLHEDLIDVIARRSDGNFVGYDFADNDSDPTGFGYSHGTAVAGLIAANGVNLRGGSGVCPGCLILPIRVNTEDEGPFLTQMAQAIRYAYLNGADVINISLAIRPYDQQEIPLIRAAIGDAVVMGRGNLGTVIVAATGNSNDEGLVFPAVEPNVIAVGGSNWCDQRWVSDGSPCNLQADGAGSTYGPEDEDGRWPDVVASGHAVWTTWTGSPSDYQAFTGTSAAAPVASGVAGLILSVAPQLTAEQVKDVLMRSADDVNNTTHPGRDRYIGTGRVNARLAVAVEAMIPSFVSLPSIITNDSWYNALEVSPLLPFRSTQNLHGTFKSLLELAPSCDPTVKSNSSVIWYKLRVPQTRRIRVKIDVLSNFIAESVKVYTGNLGFLSQVEACPATSTAEFEAQQNIVYSIMVTGEVTANPAQVRLDVEYADGVGDTVATYRLSYPLFNLKRQNVNGPPDLTILFGEFADTPVAGDWNGDGIDTIGTFRLSASTFYLRNANSDGLPDITVAYGAPGDAPVIGDWDGNGTDTVGLYRNGVFMLRNSNSGGLPEIYIQFGDSSLDRPLAGDWNGDGKDSPGLFRASAATFYLTNQATGGAAAVNYTVNYGISTDLPVAGDWNDDGITTVGVFRASAGQFYLRNSLTSGVPDVYVTFGQAGDQPLAGRWFPFVTGDPTAPNDSAPIFVPR